MRVHFSENAIFIFSDDMEGAPRVGELLTVGDANYSIVGVRHNFEPTGRGGTYTYIVDVDVKKL